MLVNRFLLQSLDNAGDKAVKEFEMQASQLPEMLLKGVKCHYSDNGKCPSEELFNTAVRDIQSKALGDEIRSMGGELEKGITRIFIIFIGLIDATMNTADNFESIVDKLSDKTEAVFEITNLCIENTALLNPEIDSLKVAAIKFARSTTYYVQHETEAGEVISQAEIFSAISNYILVMCLSPLNSQIPLGVRFSSDEQIYVLSFGGSLPVRNSILNQVLDLATKKYLQNYLEPDGTSNVDHFILPGIKDLIPKLIGNSKDFLIPVNSYWSSSNNLQVDLTSPFGPSLLSTDLDNWAIRFADFTKSFNITKLALWCQEIKKSVSVVSADYRLKLVNLIYRRLIKLDGLYACKFALNKLFSSILEYIDEEDPNYTYINLDSKFCELHTQIQSRPNLLHSLLYNSLWYLPLVTGIATITYVILEAPFNLIASSFFTIICLIAGVYLIINRVKMSQDLIRKNSELLKQSIKTSIEMIISQSAFENGRNIAYNSMNFCRDLLNAIDIIENSIRDSVNNFDNQEKLGLALVEEKANGFQNLYNLLFNTSNRNTIDRKFGKMISTTFSNLVERDNFDVEYSSHLISSFIEQLTAWIKVDVDEFCKLKTTSELLDIIMSGNFSDFEIQLNNEISSITLLTRFPTSNKHLVLLVPKDIEEILDSMNLNATSRYVKINAIEGLRKIHFANYAKINLKEL